MPASADSGAGVQSPSVCRRCRPSAEADREKPAEPHTRPTGEDGQGNAPRNVPRLPSPADPDEMTSSIPTRERATQPGASTNSVANPYQTHVSLVEGITSPVVPVTGLVFGCEPGQSLQQESRRVRQILLERVDEARRVGAVDDTVVDCRESGSVGFATTSPSSATGRSFSAPIPRIAVSGS